MSPSKIHSPEEFEVQLKLTGYKHWSLVQLIEEVQKHMQRNEYFDDVRVVAAKRGDGKSLL